MATGYKDNDTDERQQADKHYDPYSENARDLYRQENDSGLDGHPATGSDTSDKSSDLSGGASKNIDDTKQKEEAAGGWENNVGGNQPQKASFISRVKQNKKKLSVIGIGGGSLAGILFALFFAFMPLKLEMFIQNMTKYASAVPSYAIEQRTEYLITRALATRLMMLSNGDDGGKIAFCGDGSIACSLFQTYTANYFEDKMDLSFEKRTNGRVLVTINANGRTHLGSKARSWEIVVARDMGDGGVLNTVKEINRNADMKKHIKTHVSNNMKSSNTVTRFLARRILMKKYGITHWRGFEKTQAKAADLRSSMKAGIFKNTVGKVAPRTAMYMACLSGGEGCAKLLNSYSSSIDLDAIKAANGEDSAEYKAAEKQQAAIDKIQGNVDGTGTGEDSVMSKFISKRVLATVGGGAALIGVLDLVFSGIGAIDDGAMEEIGYDMMKVATIGFAFGDDTGIVVNNDRMKAGDIDIEVLGEMMSLFEDAEQSSLMAAENGIPSSATTASAATGQVTRTCQTPEGEEVVVLAPGDVVCPERKIVRDYTSSLTSNGGWEALAAVAKAWNDSLGVIVDIVGDAINGILNAIPGFEALMKALGSAIQPVLDWLVSLIFDVPPMGYETTGANNYDTLSAGLRVEHNELMAEGVGTDGKAYGGGGTVLTDEQLAMIQRETTATEQEYYNSQPVLAKIFNPRLTGSFAQHFVAGMPTSVDSLAMMPRLAFSSLITPQPAFAASAATSNPFNLPIYGYTDPAVFQADPDTYTPESCEASAKAREESFERDKSRSLVATYGVADPCALEKMVVAAALEAEGITDDPYSMPDLNEVVANSPNGDTPAATPGGSLSNSGNIKDSGWAWPGPKGSTACGFDCYANHTGMDVMGVPSGSDVYSVRDGTVLHVGPDSYMTADTCRAMTGMNIWQGTQYSIVIEHTVGGSKYQSYYTHLQPNGMKVRVGQQVKAGDLIAISGNTGCSTGPHLHVGLKEQKATLITIDPTLILGRSG